MKRIVNPFELMEDNTTMPTMSTIPAIVNDIPSRSTGPWDDIHRLAEAKANKPWNLHTLEYEDVDMSFGNIGKWSDY